MANETKSCALKLIHGCAQAHNGCLILPQSSRSRGEEPLEVDDIGQIRFIERQRLPSRFSVQEPRAGEVHTEIRLIRQCVCY